MALVCDKDELLAPAGWLQSMSEHDLLAILALVLCKINAQDPNADCSATTLLADAACFTCMSNKQILIAIINLLGDWAYNEGYLAVDTDLRGDAACLICLTPKQILAIILSLICTGINDGTILCANRQ